MHAAPDTISPVLLFVAIVLAVLLVVVIEHMQHNSEPLRECIDGRLLYQRLAKFWEPWTTQSVQFYFFTQLFTKGIPWRVAI